MVASGFVPDRGAYVLVGGRSSRFGSDKALLWWDGLPLAAALARRAAEAAPDVKLVGEPARYGRLGYPVVADAFSGAGPLGGIVAALEDSQQPWNLILACDLPLVTPLFLVQLFETAESSQAEAIVPRQPDGRDQPLCAVYSRRAARRMRGVLEAGQRRVNRALEGLAVERIQVDEPELLLNLNTAGDLPGALTVRRAAAGDVPFLLDTQQQAAGASQWAHDDYVRAVAESRVLIAEQAGAQLGFAVYQRLADDQLEIQNLAVVQPFRRRGAGSALMRFLIAREAGDLFLEVRESNDAALSFYRRLGFERIADRPAYYRHPTEGAVLLRRRQSLGARPREGR